MPVKYKKPPRKKAAPKKKSATKKRAPTKKSKKLINSANPERINTFLEENKEYKNTTKRSPSKSGEAQYAAQWVSNKARKKQAEGKFKAQERSEHVEVFTLRDIAEVPEWTHYKKIDFHGIDWKRRLDCKADPLLDLKTYFPQIFYLPWASFQEALIHQIENKIQTGGRKAFGCPRGRGKTAITRAMIIRAMKYGLRRFCFFVGSNEAKARQTLQAIKTLWYRNPLLYQDFPEIAYPIHRIEGRSNIGSQSQLYKKERTHLVWTADQFHTPTMMLDEKDVEDYLKHDPDCVTYLPDIGIDLPKYIINSAGVITRVAGIDGSIRGEAEIHPILLTQPRPDLILLDDVQKDQKADSPKSCDDLERLIESAIEYLSAPDISQACLMPCTVIREGDVSDTYLTPLKKPDWSGERHGIIEKYPHGMNDEAIYDEIDGKSNPQGRLWLQYQEIRDRSLRVFGDYREANDFYKKHRQVMDEGFEVSWKEAYKKDSGDPNKNEVSAIQAAMNWRFKDHLSFLSEGQNRPRSRIDPQALLLTPSEVAENVTAIPQNNISSQWTNLVCFVDVQDEILFYTLLAHDINFNGQIIDYGTWPQTTNRYFKKSQTTGWSLLTRAYFQEYPNEKPSGDIRKNNSTKVRAPFEAKIYYALKKCVTWLLSRTFPCQDHAQTPSRINALAIDTKWGKSSETVKRFCREYNDQRIIPYQGHPYLPSYRQIEEYTYNPQAGEIFHHIAQPHVKEAFWMIKPFRTGGRYILADVNRGKSFLMKRLASPAGSEGSISLFNSSPENHRMFAEHVAGAEYPEPIQARGITKDCWYARPGKGNDNDYLDCCVGCVILASVCGASIKSSEVQENIKRRRSIREAYNRKKKAS